MEVSGKYNVYPKFCFGCFSVDRPLHAILEFSDIFFYMLDKKYTNIDILQVTVCWECQAALRNFRKLKYKVNTVQEYLATTIANNVIKQIPPCLSKLHTTIFESESMVIYDENKLDININTEIKQETAINFELPNCNVKENIPDVKEEDLSDDWNNDDTPLVNHIDKTDKPITVTEPGVRKRRGLKQKFAIIDNGVKKEKGVQQYVKAAITGDELKSLLEKDRNDESFLKWPFRCVTCVWGSSYEGGLRKHNKACHSRKSGHVKCDICKCRFVSKKALLVHVSKHNFVRICSLCNYKSSVKGNLLGHIMIHHQKNVKCLKCGLCFYNTKLFYKHYRELHRKFICDHCGKVCHSRKVIKDHLVHRHGKNECTICNKQFKSRAVLISHNQYKHPAASDPELSYCVECDKQLENVLAFKRHLASSKAHQNTKNIVKKEEKVPCPECGKNYARKTYMMNHFRHVHLKQSNYYCEDCNKYFLNRTRYRDHRRFNHEGQKPEKNKLCSICGRGFATNRILHKHMRTHTGERPFQCNVCGAKFTQKESMQSHVKHIHLKIKRHTTGQLGKYFE